MIIQYLVTLLAPLFWYSFTGVSRYSTKTLYAELPLPLTQVSFTIHALLRRDLCDTEERAQSIGMYISPYKKLEWLPQHLKRSLTGVKWKLHSGPWWQRHLEQGFFFFAVSNSPSPQRRSTPCSAWLRRRPKLKSHFIFLRIFLRAKGRCEARHLWWDTALIGAEGHVICRQWVLREYKWKNSIYLPSFGLAEPSEWKDKKKEGKWKTNLIVLCISTSEVAAEASWGTLAPG